MINQKLNNLLKDPRTNWKYILIVIILAAIVGGGILGYLYWLSRQEVAVPEIKVSKETMQINIYFHNNKLKEQICPKGICPEGIDDCTLVFPVIRVIPRNESVEKVVATAINELLKGPTEEEKNQGYNSWIPDVDLIARYPPQAWLTCEGEEIPFQRGKVTLLDLNIKNGTVFVNFSGEIHAYGGGSCWVTGIDSEIEDTIKQFPLVREVEVAVDGETECILQP